MVDGFNNLYLWGDNYAGQLAQGDDVHREAPIIAKGLEDAKITDLSCGFQHCLALDSVGTVYGMGKNDRYQLGKVYQDSNISGQIMDNYGVAQAIPLDEPISQIAAGKLHSLFLSKTGNL